MDRKGQILLSSLRLSSLIALSDLGQKTQTSQFAKMNSFFAILACLVLIFSTNVAAVPHGDDHHGGYNRPRCLTDDQADDILTRWIWLFVKIDPAVAKRTIADNFVLMDDDTDFLEGKPISGRRKLPIGHDFALD